MPDPSPEFTPELTPEPPLTCPTGTLRRECRPCGRPSTPEPKTQGYDLSMRRQARKPSVDGTNFRRVARPLGINPQSVAN